MRESVVSKVLPRMIRQKQQMSFSEPSLNSLFEEGLGNWGQSMMDPRIEDQSGIDPLDYEGNQDLGEAAEKSVSRSVELLMQQIAVGQVENEGVEIQRDSTVAMQYDPENRKQILKNVNAVDQNDAITMTGEVTRIGGDSRQEIWDRLQPKRQRQAMANAGVKTETMDALLPAMRGNIPTSLAEGLGRIDTHQRTTSSGVVLSDRHMDEGSMPADMLAIIHGRSVEQEQSLADRPAVVEHPAMDRIRQESELRAYDQAFGAIDETKKAIREQKKAAKAQKAGGAKMGATPSTSIGFADAAKKVLTSPLAIAGAAILGFMLLRKGSK